MWKVCYNIDESEEWKGNLPWYHRLASCIELLRWEVSGMLDKLLGRRGRELRGFGIGRRGRGDLSVRERG